MNQIDRIAGRYDAHKVAGNSDIVGTKFALNDIECPKSNAFRLLYPRSRRGTKPDAENRGIRFREYLSSHAWHQEVYEPDGCDEITQRYRPAHTQHQAEIPRIESTQAVKQPFTLFTVRVLQEPCGEHRNE